MTPIWGINWQRYHADQLDMPHIARMGYRSFTTYEWMWSNRDFVYELLSVARPDAIFLNRDHPLSEQKDSDWEFNPAMKGRNHADEWAKKVKEGRVFTPLDRTYFLGINEPDSHHYQRQIDAYNEAYCRRLAEHGLRGAAYSFGVGHPSTVDLRSDTPPDWSWYAASAAAVLEGGHLAAFHEYGAPLVDGYGWEYWCNRSSFCPYAFDAGLDECGIDNGVLQSGILKGWAAFMSPEAYLIWLDGFQSGMAKREPTRKINILFHNIFGYDHGSGKDKDWHSFDIRSMRSQLENFNWTKVDVKDQEKIHIPVVIAPPSGKPSDGWIIVPAGANVREQPITGDILTAIPYGEQVQIIDRTTKNGQVWFWIRYKEHEGYTYSKLIGDTKPAPSEVPVVDAPASPPSTDQDKWLRSRAFIERWEGGYQNIANDAGNWTGCAVGKGEQKGTNFGISACSYPHLDIKNLTLAQATEIYYRDYWLKSGANLLAWPLCLLVLDTAVLHGVGAAKSWLAEMGPNPYGFAARRLQVYTGSGNWNFWGKAWTQRVAELLEEMAK